METATTTNSNTSNTTRSKLWFKIFYAVIQRPEFSTDLRGYPVMRGGRVEKNLGKIVPTFFVARSGRVWFRAPEGVWGIQIGREIKHLPDICQEIERRVGYAIYAMEYRERRQKEEEEMKQFIAEYRQGEIPLVEADQVEVVKEFRGDEYTIYLLNNGWVLYQHKHQSFSEVEELGRRERVEVSYTGGEFECSCGRGGLCDHIKVISRVLDIPVRRVGGGLRYEYGDGYAIILYSEDGRSAVEKDGRVIYHIAHMGCEDDHIIRGACDCPAGRYGKLCKHFRMWVDAMSDYARDRGYEPIYNGVQVRWQG